MGEDSALPPVTGVTGSIPRGVSDRKPEGRPRGSSWTGGLALRRHFQGGFAADWLVCWQEHPASIGIPFRDTSAAPKASQCQVRCVYV